MFDHALKADIAGIEPAAPALSVSEGRFGPLRLSPAALARAKEREYWAMFYASLPLFLVAAAAKRLLPAGEGYHSAYEAPKRGLLADASHMAHTLIPFAFWR